MKNCIFFLLFTVAIISCKKNNTNRNTDISEEYLVKSISDTSKDAKYIYDYDNENKLYRISIYSIRTGTLLYKYNFTYNADKLSKSEEFEYYNNGVSFNFEWLDTFIYIGNKIDYKMSFDMSLNRKYVDKEEYHYINNEFLYYESNKIVNNDNTDDSTVFVYNPNQSLKTTIDYEFPNNDRSIIYTYIIDFFYDTNVNSFNFGNFNDTQNPAITFRALGSPQLYLFNKFVPIKRVHKHNGIVDYTYDYTFEFNQLGLISKLKVKSQSTSSMKIYSYDIEYIHKF